MIIYVKSVGDGLSPVFGTAVSISLGMNVVDGTAAGLGISSGLSARLIASLKEKGVLREEERGDGTYYFLAEQRHD